MLLQTAGSALATHTGTPSVYTRSLGPLRCTLEWCGSNIALRHTRSVIRVTISLLSTEPKILRLTTMWKHIKQERFELWKVCAGSAIIECNTSLCRMRQLGSRRSCFCLKLNTYAVAAKSKEPEFESYPGNVCLCDDAYVMIRQHECYLVESCRTRLDPVPLPVPHDLLIRHVGSIPCSIGTRHL